MSSKNTFNVVGTFRHIMWSCLNHHAAPSHTVLLKNDIFKLDASAARRNHRRWWVDEVDVREGDREVVAPTVGAVSDSKLVKSHVTVFRKAHGTNWRHLSQDSMSKVMVIFKGLTRVGMFSSVVPARSSVDCHFSTTREH